MGRSHLTTAIVLAGCAGFLLGVLWMDLMFDVQALGHPAAVPDQALASIASYYRRVTTDAAPMGGLIATVMLIAVGSALLQAVRAPGWRSAVALLLIVFPVALALIRVVPNAVRLGGRGDPADIQGALARAIAHDHIACFAAVAAFLVIQGLVARRGRGRSA